MPMARVKITAEPVRLNGRLRYHFVGPGGKSVRTWASRRDAIRAGERDYQWVRVATDTPEFKKWFGDSKVVDKAGQPLVVHHGVR